jgi:putative ABC transport system permease protein
VSIRTRVSALAEGILIALDALRANKVRAALTILGVAIGVFVVVVMSAAIHGISENVARDFESAGPTSFTVQRFPIFLGSCDDSGETCTWRNNPPIRIAEVMAMRDLPSVRGVVARGYTGGSFKYRDRFLSGAGIRANTPGWLEIDGGDVMPGRSFTNAENTAAAKVIIVSTKMAERLFGESDPIGKVIAVRSQPYEVIGVYKQPVDFSGEDRPFAIVPFETARRYLNVSERWVEAVVRPRTNVPRDVAIDDVTAFLRGVRGLRPGAENNFAIITPDKLFETFNKVTRVFFLVMLTLSAVGLMVGGVGVVAIMMISVTERTREIGVRKALGATRGTILWQFLIEAVTLTGIGAMSGLAVGWVVSLIIRSSSPIPATIPPLAILAALGASALTGILFGLYPAAKAAKLDPIDALRYE